MIIFSCPHHGLTANILPDKDNSHQNVRQREIAEVKAGEISRTATENNVFYPYSFQPSPRTEILPFKIIFLEENKAA